METEQNRSSGSPGQPHFVCRLIPVSLFSGLLGGASGTPGEPMHPPWMARLGPGWAPRPPKSCAFAVFWVTMGFGTLFGELLGS